jgi:hypothetical protein
MACFATATLVVETAVVVVRRAVVVVLGGTELVVEVEGMVEVDDVAGGTLDVGSAGTLVVVTTEVVSTTLEVELGGALVV